MNQRATTHHQDQTGFTLIELMIALAVFAIGLLALSAMMVTAVKGNVFAKKMSTAENLAQQKIEYLMNLKYSQVSYAGTDGAGVQSTTPPCEKAGSLCCVENYGEIPDSQIPQSKTCPMVSTGCAECETYKQFKRTTTVTDLDNRLKKVTVEVQWRHEVSTLSNPPARRVTLMTFRAF